MRIIFNGDTDTPDRWLAFSILVAFPIKKLNFNKLSLALNINFGRILPVLHCFHKAIRYMTAKIYPVHSRNFQTLNNWFCPLTLRSYSKNKKYAYSLWLAITMPQVKDYKTGIQVVPSDWPTIQSVTYIYLYYPQRKITFPELGSRVGWNSGSRIPNFLRPVLRTLNTKN